MNKNYFLIKVDREVYIKIHHDEITHISAQGDYSKIHLGAETYVTHIQLNKFENILPEQFFRCHRGFIINLDAISEIKESQARVKADKVPVADSKRSEILKLMNYLPTIHEERKLTNTNK